MMNTQKFKRWFTWRPDRAHLEQCHPKVDTCYGLHLCTKYEDTRSRDMKEDQNLKTGIVWGD